MFIEFINKNILLILCSLHLISFSQNDLNQAELFFQQGKFDKSLEILEKAGISNSNNYKYISMLVECYQELEKFDEAQSILTSQLMSTNNPQYLIEIGYNHQLQNKLSLADNFYSQAVERAKNNPALGYSIALKFEKFSLVDEAILVYRLLIDKTKNYNYEYRIAGLYATKKDISNMFLSYLNFTAANENYFDQTLRLLQDYISDNSNSEYNLMLKKIILSKLRISTNTFYNKMLSWLYVQENDYKKAFAQQKAIINRTNDGMRDILTFSYLLIENNEYDIANEALNLIISKAQEPNLIRQAKTELLVLELLRNDSPDHDLIESGYLSIFESYGINDYTINSQLSYVEFLVFHAGEEKKAIKFLIQNLKQRLSDLSISKIKLMLADVYLINEQYNRAQVYYTQVYSNSKSSILTQEALFKAAKTSFYKGDFNWAESQLKILKSSTSQLISNDALELYLLIRDHKIGNDFELPLKLYAEADFLIFKKKYDQSLETLENLILSYPDHPIVDECLFLQAKILSLKENYKLAVDKYKRIIQLYSSEILADDAYFYMAEIFRTQLNDKHQARWGYEKVIFDHQDSIHAVVSKKYYRNLDNEINNEKENNL